MEVSAAEANKLTSSSISPPPPTDPTMTPHHFTTQGRDNMLSLAASLPAGSTEKIALLKGVSRWSLEETGRTLTDTHLGLALAGAYREAGGYGQAANKFTQMASLVEVEEEEGGKGKEEMEKLANMYAEVLKEWSMQGYVGEKDLFVARAVLQLVVRGGNATQKGPTLAYARALLNATLTTAEAENETQLTDSPLLHYLSLLLDLIDTHIKSPTPTQTSPRSPTLLPPTSELFRLLTARYQPVLERDPSFPQATQKIGEMYFNIFPPQNPMQALLQSMMGGGGGGGGLLGSMLGGGAGGGGGLLGALGGMGL